MTSAHAPSITEMLRHFILAIVLTTLLLMQVRIMKTVAPSQLAEVADLARASGKLMLVYALLPMLRYVGSLTLQTIAERFGGGESA